MRIGTLIVVFTLFFGAASLWDIAPSQAASPNKVSAAESKSKPVKKASASSARNSAKKKTAAKQRLKKIYGARPSKQTGDKFAAVVVDAATGQVLYEKNAGEVRYPASLTKMMTLYLTFDALKKGKLSLYKNMEISEKAAGQPETNINLVPGHTLLVEDAIKALVVRSANDAAVVLAEQIGGTQWNFAQMMTQKARELGMRDTIFRNPNGLPDNGQYTSAYDMARLGIALRRDFPDYFKYFKTEQFNFEGVTYTTHNRVMLRYNGADGIKTGYIRASGFNLVTSVKKNGYDIVAVVMGGTSATARDDMMINLLDRTFADLSSHRRNRLAQSAPATASRAVNFF